MTPFFRRIRQKLANENKFLKYSRYAIGEIVLVVIGILIALQINTWKGARQDQKEAHKILLSLKHEIETNNSIIDGSIDFYKKRLNAIKLLRIQFNPNKKVTSDSLEVLISNIATNWKYEPVKSIIESIVSSGKIDLIKNDSVKNTVHFWGTAINKHDELYRSQDELWKRNIEPIIYENYPLVVFDTILKSNFKANTDAIFNNLKNENLFFIFEHRVNILINWTEFIKQEQNNALSIINFELNETIDL